VEKTYSVGDEVAPLDHTYPEYRRGHIGTVVEVRGEGQYMIVVVKFPPRQGCPPPNKISYSRHDLWRQESLLREPCHQSP